MSTVSTFHTLFISCFTRWTPWLAFVMTSCDTLRVCISLSVYFQVHWREWTAILEYVHQKSSSFHAWMSFSIRISDRLWFRDRSSVVYCFMLREWIDANDSSKTCYGTSDASAMISCRTIDLRLITRKLWTIIEHDPNLELVDARWLISCMEFVGWQARRKYCLLVKSIFVYTTYVYMIILNLRHCSKDQ
jgi:hypothetical protein